MIAFKRELTVPGVPADLSRINEFIEDASEQARVDGAACFDLQLAIEEACANVMEHAYAGQGGAFTLTFQTSGRDVVITLRDHGRPFNPTAIGFTDLDRPLQDRPVGGMGLHLMHRLMDEVRFSFDYHGNTLVMVKRGISEPTDA